MWNELAGTRPVMYVRDLSRTAIDKCERELFLGIMGQEGFGEKICNTPPSDVKRIGFIVNGIARYAGGSTTILRIGTHLNKKGYEVSYLNYSPQSLSEAETNSSFNLPGYQGTFKDWSSCGHDEFDVLIATAWDSFYRLGRFLGYKMYFVQDYEPYLANGYEESLMAKATYEFGAHIVSLGTWNIKEIERQCKTDSIMDSVTFPYDPAEYKVEKLRDYRSYKNKKTIKIAAFIKEEGKRIPRIVQINLLKVKEILAERGINLDVIFFGIRKSYKPMLGRNLGKLTRQEIIKLYLEADFGMCASMTNISLVPFEMIAMGLPLIEYQQGSFSEFLPGNTAILTDYRGENLANTILDHLENPEKIERIAKAAYESIKDLSWERTGDEFVRILERIKET